ncbi:MAG: PAS domain S-box protein [Syntrophobacteraceae bacterium]|nr:PAS domain S-box protein [Syntrophobacteraceae bacterium]
MRDETKTKEQLLAELCQLRERVHQLEQECVRAGGAEKTSGESEERYRTLFDGMTEGFALHEIVTDEQDRPTDYRFLDVNPAFERLTGLKRAELLGKCVLEVLPDIEPSWIENYDRVALTGKPVHFEAYSTGMGRWFDVFAYRPAPRQFAVMFTEITGRKHAEEALRGSEQHFRTLVESAPDAIFIRVGGRFVFVNKAAVDLFGATSKDQLIGAPVIERLHPDSREIIRERMRLLTEKCTPVPTIEHQYIKLDGSTVDVQASGVPFGYEGNSGALVFVRNITEQKVAENALLSSENKYKELFHQFNAVLEAIPDRLTFIAKDFKTLWANRKAVESMVSGDGRSIGDCCYKLWHSRTRPCDRCFLPQVIASGEPTTETISEPDGKIWEYRFIPVKDDAGMVSNVVRLGRDITEHRSLEAQLRQAQKLEAIGTLAGGIAHDFNNILGAIMGYTEMALMDTAENDPIKHDLQEVFKAAIRARDLVKQILAFSRKGEAQSRQRIEIAPVIKEASKLLRAALPSTIDLQQQISKNPAIVIGDPTQLHQVVVNLCTNAAHAMRKNGGILKVTLGEVVLDADAAAAYEDLQPGAYVRLAVSDTGHGMDAATLERIFDPYFTTKEVGEGSGLGLAVVHGIVKRHEGAIRVDSEPGKGTAFEILLPGIAHNSAGNQIEPEQLPGGTERILLVDDELALATLSKRMLVNLGYQVTALTSSLEAIELFQSKPEAFDLVITDFTMPHMTGVEMARGMLEIRRDIPIVLCTGYSDIMGENTAKEIGIHAFIMKPFGRRNLARVVRRVFDQAAQ